jgi:flagellin-like hook-associated protein FlgL
MKYQSCNVQVIARIFITYHFAQLISQVTISMNSSKTSAVAIALIIGLGFAGTNAHALVTAPTPVTATVGSSLVFDNLGVATFSQGISPGYTDFSAQYTFTTTASSGGGATSVSSFNGSYFSTGFTSFSLVDVNNGNSVVASGSVGPSFVSQVGFTNLNPNTTYGLNLVGTVTNPSAGGYFVGSIAVNAVPEPGEYLLLLCGLGLIGFISMKRGNGHGLAIA